MIIEENARKMKQIKENAYRVVGILAGTSARELQKQKSKISAYSKAGKIYLNINNYICVLKDKTRTL